MSSLITGFAMRMRKRAANTQERTTSGLEVPGDKRSKLSRFDEEVQVDLAVIAVDSPERVLEASSAVEGAAQDTSCAVLEDEVPIGEFPLVDDASIEASLVEATNALPHLARRASFAVDSARRPPDRLVLSLYVKPMEWAKPTEDAPALDQETARALINYWRPFNQRDPSVAYMSDLYPHNFCV